MKRKRLVKIWSMALMVTMLSGMMPMTSMAATTSITSVVIRVGTDKEAGDLLSEDIGTYNDSTDAKTGETYVGTNSTKYSVRSAEWTSSSTSEKELKIGDEPKMKIYLDADGYDSRDREYVFRGGYSSSNVSIKGGTFVSARPVSSGRELEVTVKLSPIKGQYPTPDDAYWRGSGYGRAVWESDSDNRKLLSGYYDVYLYRGSTAVKKLEAYQGTSYNFYPYMTKKGTYSFKVRSVPAPSSSLGNSSRSEWLESDEVYIDEQHVSDGSGQTDGNGTSSSAGQVGWIQDGSTWYYRYPDGSYQTNSWLKVNNKWYLFDGSGKMLTGWQARGDQWFYLNGSGEMLTGWLKSADGKWYYMNTNAGSMEGAMLKGWINLGGKIYYLGGDGAMLEGWNQVEGNWYYFYPGYGHKAVNTYIDSFYVDGNGVWRK